MAHPLDTLRTVARRALVPDLTWAGRRTVLRAGLRGVGPEPRPTWVALRHGALRLDAAHGPDWRVFDEVFVWREYDVDLRGAAVVDVGAHRGLFAAYALLHGARHVVAYEPAAGNLPYLEATLSSFGPGRTTVHARAVGAEGGVERLFTYDESWSHSVVHRPDRALVAEVEVDRAALADALREAAEQADRVVVKVDAEGAEYGLLLGTEPATLAPVDVLVAEVHGYADGRPESLVEHLEAAGLAVRLHRDPASPHCTVYASRSPGA